MFQWLSEVFHVPDCVCKVEDKLLAHSGVLEASVNPIEDVVLVAYDADQTDLDAIKHVLHRCGYNCEWEHGHTAHAHMEHEHHKAEHHDHHAMMEKDMRNRFWVSLVLTIPVLLLSPTIQGWFRFSLLTFTGSNHLLFVLASLIAIYGGWPFYKGARRCARVCST